jgi:hypothetical protein
LPSIVRSLASVASTTTARTRRAGRQPATRPAPHAARSYQRMVRSRAPMSRSSVFTSITRSVRVGPWKARRSIQPRDRPCPISTSTATCQPVASSWRLTEAMQRAWTKSRCPLRPLHGGASARTVNLIPSSIASRASLSRRTAERRPCSTRQIVAWDMRQRTASSRWLQPADLRARMTAEPKARHRSARSLICSDITHVYRGALAWSSTSAYRLVHGTADRMVELDTEAASSGRRLSSDDGLAAARPSLCGSSSTPRPMLRRHHEVDAAGSAVVKGAGRWREGALAACTGPSEVPAFEVSGRPITPTRRSSHHRVHQGQRDGDSGVAPARIGRRFRPWPSTSRSR